MLSDKTYEMGCADCGHVIKTKEIEGDCPKCNGFMRIISKFGKCKCGTMIQFSRFTNTCHKCNRDYNSSGQELAPRSQWGEETGECLSDILQIK